MRAALIGSALLATALLIGLDRSVVGPFWSRRLSTPGQTRAGDRALYHGRTFAVTRVVDADTLHIDAPDAGASSTKVRLLGIDAPELAHDGQPEMYFGSAAAEYARQLARGTQVTVYLDDVGPSRGKYGRLLAYVEMPNGQSLNELLLTEGYAYADLRFPHSYYYRYKQLEASARVLKKGLWASVTNKRLPSWRRHRSSE